MLNNLPGISVFSLVLSVLINLPSEGKSAAQNPVQQVSLDYPSLMAQSESTEACELDTGKSAITDRIIFLSGEIFDSTAESVITELLRLDAEDPEKDIYLYINSPGGSVYAGLAIYDAIQSVQADVVTVSMGLSASMASILLAAGTPGKRFAFPNSRVMIHQTMGWAEGNPEDLEIGARENRLLLDALDQIFATHTGRSLAQIRRDTARDYYMSAAEAVSYGIVDQVIDHHPVTLLNQ